MRTPYLIQRVIERQDIQPFKDGLELGFDSYFRCDYMGSAEFEFGALPKSLKTFTKNPELKIVEFNHASDQNKENLFIISSEIPAGVYFEAYMEKLLFDELILKERSELKSYFFENVSRLRTTIWWDIENHVMFTFGKARALKIMDAIKGTRANKTKLKDLDWI